MSTTITTPHGDEIAIAPGEHLYCVEGASADQYLTAKCAEDAVQEAAQWQYGDLAEVTVEWRGTGPGTALAEYEVRVNGALQSRRIVVYEVAEGTA